MSGAGSAETMNSRRRILNAMRREPVDHTPLWMRFWMMGRENRLPLPWQDPVQRASYLTARGIDDVLLLEPPLGYVENYRPDLLEGITARVEVTLGDAPEIRKTFSTPAGSLEIHARMTEDWPHPQDAFLFSDYNISRQFHPIVQRQEDLAPLRCLLGKPSLEQTERFEEQARETLRHAGRLGIAVEGGMTALGDSALWLLGHERVLSAQFEEPDFVHGFLDVILEWEMGRAETVCAAGADLVTHMAWYEGSDFWSPRNFRKYLKPRLRQLVEAVHAHGALFRYIITKGWTPIQDDLLEIGVDCVSGIDPVQDQINLRETKARIGRRVCLMGGMNSTVTLTQGSEEVIRGAVDEAFDALSPGGGFILYPVDAIFSDFEWEKVEVMIDQWRYKHTAQ
jgi:uroporphyrinogen-III decarboxylase